MERIPIEIPGWLIHLAIKFSLIRTFVLGAQVLAALRFGNPRFPTLALLAAFLNGKTEVFPTPFDPDPNHLTSFVLGAGIEPATLPSSGECSTN